MAEDNGGSGGSSNVGDIARVVASLAKEWPIYPDVAQPAAKELGKTLHAVARVVNVLAAPLRFTAWAGEQLEIFVKDRVLLKLQYTSDEALQPPPLHIGVPVLEALRYTGADPELSELYANLLANAMDANTVSSVHPGFVDVIKSMTPDEAKVMRYFAGNSTAPLTDLQLILKRHLFRPTEFLTVVRNYSLVGYRVQCGNPLQSPSYIDNLVRLGLLEINRQHRMMDKTHYDEILSSPFAVQVTDLCKRRGYVLRFTKHLVAVTEFGKLFISACVDDKAQPG